MFVFRWIERRTLMVSLGLLGLVAIVAFSGCNKCQQLAEQICACEDNLMARDSCRKALDIHAQHKAFSRAMDENLCAHILVDTDPLTRCDCMAIRNHEFQRCGMTRNPE